MKRIILIAMFVAFGCKERNCVKERVSKEESVELIKNYFHALSNKDFDKVKKLATKDFIIFERGLVWNNDRLIKYFKTMPQTEIEFKLSKFRIETDCEGGFVSYRNDGSFKTDSTYTKLSWLESVYLKKVNDSLKLDFLHSSIALQ